MAAKKAPAMPFTPKPDPKKKKSKGGKKPNPFAPKGY
jgi:hypothetical protein